MGSEYILTTNGELYHWGIKGMKWGIRRYQNKDGSLTAAGRKRYSNDNEDSETPKQKTVKDMSDAEIRSAIARKQLENQYLQYYPKHEKPESFAKKFVDQAVKPAAINAGKDFIEKSLKKVTNDILKDKVDPNSLEALEAANKKLRAKITNDWLKKGIDTTANWDAAGKQYELQGKMKDAAEEKAKKETEAKEAKKEAKRQATEDKKNAKAEAERQAEENARAERDKRKAQQRKEWENYVRSHDETMRRPVDYFVGTPEVVNGRNALDRIDLNEFMLDWDDD